MGYHEYCKTWVSLIRETLLNQMVQENIPQSVIKKPKVAGHLMNGKKKKVYENCIFLLEADQINSAKVKIKRIP